LTSSSSATDLTPPNKAEIVGPLKIELKWVEDVHISTSEIELPSPDILETDWGLSSFLACSEIEFAERCKAKKEDATFCHRLAKKGPKAPLESASIIDQAQKSLVDRKADWIVPVTALLPEAPVEKKVPAWLQKLRQVVAENRIQPRRAIIYQIKGREVQGAIVGTRIANEAAVEMPVEDEVTIRKGGGSPNSPRNWAVVLFLGLKSGKY